MSKFQVSLEEVEVFNHPNADKLDIIRLVNKDYQCVAKKDDFKTGDKAIYFPIDSLIPESVLEIIGLNGKLSGKDRNRVKTIKLRGEISQGIVAKPELFFTDKIPDNLTVFFGIEKYEPEPVACLNGNLLPLPEGVEKYDIENAENYRDIVNMLMDNPVFITEKMEGMNYSITATKETTYVNQRNYTIQEKRGKEHDFWKITRENHLDEIAHELLETYNAKQLTLRGEYLGPNVQGNIYNFKKNEIQLFDVKVDDWYLNPTEFCSVKNIYAIDCVPILAYSITLRDFLSGKTIREASNGKSRDNTKILREGIVIKPMAEMYITGFGRVIIKQRSPEYLAKEK